jgi:hypothetical protein
VAMVSDDNVLYGLVSVIAIEFGILARKFENMSGNFEKNAWRSCIENHERLVTMANGLQNIFAPSFFVNFVLSSTVICMSAFQASTAHSYQDVLFFVSFAISSILQIFLQCFFGQMLKDAVGELPRVIFECGWERCDDVAVKKELVLVLARAQKRRGMTILGVWEVDLEQFGNVSGEFYLFKLMENI